MTPLNALNQHSKTPQQSSSHSALKAVFYSTRPNFLILPAVLVMCAFALHYSKTQDWDGLWFGLTLLGAVLAHAWVNLHNEYTDTLNGLDAITQKTPFSGGTGGMVQFPQAIVLAKWMLRIGLASLFVLLVVFVDQFGGMILLFALAGGLLMLSYSRFLVHYTWLCWMSAGMAFGPLMLLAAYWVSAQAISLEIVWIAIVVFMWVNNLLLLNQVPDFFADKTVQRSNLIIRYGLKKALKMYQVSGFVSVLFLVILSFTQWSLHANLVWLLLSLIWFALIFAQMRQIDRAYQSLPAGIKEAYENPSDESLPSDFDWLKNWQKALGLNVTINILLPLSIAALLIFTPQFS